jgi:hypothetical protein
MRDRIVDWILSVGKHREPLQGVALEVVRLAIDHPKFPLFHIKASAAHAYQAAMTRSAEAQFVGGEDADEVLVVSLSRFRDETGIDPFSISSVAALLSKLSDAEAEDARHLIGQLALTWQLHVHAADTALSFDQYNVLKGMPRERRLDI